MPKPCTECIGVGGHADGTHGRVLHSSTPKKLGVGGSTITQQKTKQSLNKVTTLGSNWIWVPAQTWNKPPLVNGHYLKAWAYFPGGDTALVYSPDGSSKWETVLGTKNEGPTGLMIAFKASTAIGATNKVGVGGHLPEHIDVQSIQFAIDRAKKSTRRPTRKVY